MIFDGESGPGAPLDSEGCDDYDTKPIEFSRLLGKIEFLLSKDGQL